ncbi:hypothetical protein ADU59_18065 [Pararhizobium polonicum]|uniref:Calcium-binding protein n=1 Tax=Pararhizobium polonicum TaxID=1612624 RepID=A0A1C7NYL1_9HYPH|nr:calcium-binding protein [Pararhizobium polonicum]OBZ94102.1 hypothetical protein ADU59_18065 [Pararhizobium polonicum]
MPNTPVTWREDFIANLNATGSQSDPVITQLASGYFLVVWTDSDDSSVPGSPAGTDIIGRIFDSQGNAVTDEIRLNTRNTGDSEFNPTVTALSDGGFVIAYDELGSFDDLDIETYSFNPATFVVTSVGSNDLFFDNGAPNPQDPSIASVSSTSVLAAYHTVNADGSDNIIIRTYNPTTNTVGAEITLFAGATGTGEDASGPDVAAMTNGNYVIVYSNNNPSPANDSILFDIRDSTGVAVTSGTVDSGTEFNDPQVTALAGGGFVVAYAISSNAGDIKFRVFDGNGAALTGGGPFNAGVTSLANSQNEPAVIGLADGTFILVWDDDTSGQIVGQRYSVSGQNVFTVSGEFVVDNSGGTSITEIELAAFQDGRFSVTWNDGGDIRVKIMDTRDTVNTTAVYAPNSEQVGTIGNDVFTANGSASKVFGHDGNDIITESGSIKQYFGGNGDDTLIVVSPINDDVHDGGNGNDTIDWSLSGVSGATFDLLNGLASDAVDSETMTGFENIIATNNADKIFGNSNENIITALDGNDTIEGGFSTDTINAGAGNDTIIVRDGQFADNVVGGSGTDRYVFAYTNQRINIDLGAGTLQVFDSVGGTFGPALTVSGVENVTGGSLNDVITGDTASNTLEGRSGNDALSGDAGNDTLVGGNGADALSGGTGSDTASYFDAAAAVTASLVDSTINTGAAAGDTYSSIENLTGSNFNDNLNGTSGVNTIKGGDGNDSIRAFSGNDTLTGENGNDTLNGGNGADILSGGAGSDTASYFDATSAVIASLSDATVNTGQAAGDTYSSIENLTGSIFNDSLYGNNGNNTILGRAGNDVLKGYGGNDTLTGGSGNDTFAFNRALSATTNVDTITDFNVSADTISLDDAIFTAIGAVGVLAASAFRSNTTGLAGDASDRIIYESDTGELYYDSNGTGAGGSVLFAKVSTGLALTNADFLIV